MKRLLASVILIAYLAYNGSSATEPVKLFPWTQWRADAFKAANSSHAPLELNGLNADQLFHYWEQNRGWHLKPWDWMLPWEELSSELTANVSRQDWEDLGKDKERRVCWSNIIVPRGYIDWGNVYIRVDPLIWRLKEEKLALNPTEEVLMKNIVDGFREHARAYDKLYDELVTYSKLLKTEEQKLDITRDNFRFYINHFPYFPFSMESFEKEFDCLKRAWPEDGNNINHAENKLYRLYRNREEVRRRAENQRFAKLETNYSERLNRLEKQHNEKAAILQNQLVLAQKDFTVRLDTLQQRVSAQLLFCNQNIQSLSDKLSAMRPQTSDRKDPVLQRQLLKQGSDSRVQLLRDALDESNKEVMQNFEMMLLSSSNADVIR